MINYSIKSKSNYQSFYQKFDARSLKFSEYIKL